MLTKKKTVRAPLTSLTEMRANTGMPAPSPALDFVVGHQAAFPWLNSVMMLPATRRDEN